MSTPPGPTGPPPGPPAGTRQHPTSGILALVFGILGVTALPLIGAVLALVFGYQCRGEAERQPEHYTDDFGRAGRILGWIGIALSAFGILMVLLVFLLFVPATLL